MMEDWQLSEPLTLKILRIKLNVSGSVNAINVKWFNGRFKQKHEELQAKLTEDISFYCSAIISAIPRG